MRRDDIERQAMAFVSYYLKAPTGDWGGALLRWAASKDMHPILRHEVSAVAHDELLARGIITHEAA